MTEVFYFFLWTLILYVIHRLVHVIPFLKRIHWAHHRFILKELKKLDWKKNPTGWHWSNLFLFSDNWPGTLDLWITEVIPTVVFSYLTGQWWILCFYYIWTAFIQETIEHNPTINFYPFTSGKWHLIHHRNFNKNYGLFLPIWDRLFRTELL